MSTLTLTLTLTLKQHSLKQDRPQPWPWPRPRNLLTPSGLQVQSALTTRPRCLIYIYEASGGSRGGVRGARTPLPLFLDQNEARRGKRFSFFFWRAAPPYLRVWMTPRTPPPRPHLKIRIRHWNTYGHGHEVNSLWTRQRRRKGSIAQKCDGFVFNNRTNF